MNKSDLIDPVVKRISGLLLEKGKSEKELTDYLGLPPGTMSKWKYYDSKLYLKYILEICNYLETDPDYLFLGNVIPKENKNLTTVENEMIDLFRTINERQQKCILETLRIFSETQ